MPGGTGVYGDIDAIGELRTVKRRCTGDDVIRVLRIDCDRRLVASIQARVADLDALQGGEGGGGIDPAGPAAGGSRGPVASLSLGVMVAQRGVADLGTLGQLVFYLLVG